jgi:hypothetical protein
MKGWTANRYFLLRMAVTALINSAVYSERNL